MNPKTKYAKAGDVYIGYQVVGDGPADVVFFPNWFSNIEMFEFELHGEHELKGVPGHWQVYEVRS